MYAIDHKSMNPATYAIKSLPLHETPQHDLHSLPPFSEQHTGQNMNQSPQGVTPPPLNEPQSGTNYASISEKPVHYTDNNVNPPAYSVRLRTQHEVQQHGTDFLLSSPQLTHPAERNINLPMYPTTPSPVHETQHGSNYPSPTQVPHTETLYAVQPPSLQNGTDYPSPTQQQLHHTVLLTEAGTQYGPASQNMECPHCRLQVLTRVKTVPSERTHLYAFITFIAMCPLFWLPYCISSCQNKDHFCPNCGAYLGTASQVF